MDITVKPQTQVGGKSKITSKYFCETSGSEAKISMQLEALVEQGAVKPADCWVIAMDVSESMSRQNGEDQMTLLDRVKTSASIVVKFVAESDLLSLVSFSSCALTECDVTRMDSVGKEIVSEHLHTLDCDGRTNIEAGIMHSLENIKRAKDRGLLDKYTRGGIILFTDGKANEGSRSPSDIVEKYQTMEKSIGAPVELFVFTVGDVEATLLETLSSRLGSGAFNWLDESKQLEADILIPNILSQKTFVNNVRVYITTMGGAMITHTTEEHEVRRSETEVNYFLHMLPLDRPKVFRICLSLPLTALDHQRNLEILEVTTKYCDETGREVCLHERIPLTGKSLLETCTAGHGITVGHDSDDRMEILRCGSAFIYADNRHLTSWKQSKRAVSRNAREEYVGHMVKLMRHPTPSEERSEIILALNQIKPRVALIISDEDDSEYKGWVAELKTLEKDMADVVEISSRSGTGARVASMISAFARNSPAPEGVFNQSGRRDGTASTRNIAEFLRNAKKSLTKVAGPRLTFKAIRTVLEGETFIKLLRDIKNRLRPSIAPAFASNLFSDVIFVLSTKLQDRQRYLQMIRDHRGTAVKSLPRHSNGQYYVVLPRDGEKVDPELFDKATEMKVAIVRSGFIDACIEQEEMAAWHMYGIRSSYRMK